MSKIVWDQVEERFYETGVRNGVLYVMEGNEYGDGVAWNGLSAVTESPSGAEASPIYADDIKYLNLISAEEFGATIEAYTYPDEFEECDGSGELVKGVHIGQQPRKTFGFCYRTAIGNASEGDAHGYKIHILYGCKASPSERAYQTVNDSPEAITFSWEISTTPVTVTGMRPTANLTIDSRNTSKAALAKIEEKLYGTDDTEPQLLLPDEILSIVSNTVGD